MNILYTSYYKDKSTVRQKELDLCMKMNCNNKNIDKIYVILEGQQKDFPILGHPKVNVIEGPRPTYRDFFNLANSVCTEEDINIIANTDIFYERSIILCQEKMRKNDCYALSRYHYFKDHSIKLHNEKYSQDTWIFKGKIRHIEYCDFFMGMRGCDNRIAYEIRAAGYDILNPAHSIISVHYHLSDLHNYTDTDLIPKPYLPVELCSLK